MTLSFSKKTGTGVIAGVFATVVALAVPLVSGSEGLRTRTYLDPVGIPTVCFGETLNVHMGDVHTITECQNMLKARLGGFLVEMRACTHSQIPLPAKTETALLAFTYNVGSKTYCNNIAAKRINQGHLWEACQALSLYVKAGGRQLPGLVRRRAEERALCEAGLAESGLKKGG